MKPCPQLSACIVHHEYGVVCRLKARNRVTDGAFSIDGQRSHVRASVFAICFHRTTIGSVYSSLQENLTVTYGFHPRYSQRDVLPASDHQTVPRSIIMAGDVAGIMMNRDGLLVFLRKIFSVQQCCLEGSSLGLPLVTRLGQALSGFFGNPSDISRASKCPSSFANAFDDLVIQQAPILEYCRGTRNGIDVRQYQEARER